MCFEKKNIIFLISILHIFPLYNIEEMGVCIGACAKNPLNGNM
jgi:hypothetical protein